MTETIDIPGRPLPLVLEHRGGRVCWRVGDCQGDELTRDLAIAMASRFVGVRIVAEVRPTVRAQLRQVGPSSRRPGAGPNVGVTYVTLGPLRDWKPAEMCCHGLPLGRCEACGATFCRHPGAREHDCFNP